MANKMVVTDAFVRVSFPHLDAPHKYTEKDDEKYRLQLMFAKDNTYDHPEVGEIESHPYEIIDVLSEVCDKEFNFPIQDVADVAELKDEVGVQFPPTFKDGDKVKLKENGRPVPGQYDEKTAGYWLLNVTSWEQPGCIGPDENEIDPKTIYSGCWCRVQVEVSAYYSKENAPIVNIDLVNVQYCYDDESLGGRTPRPDAKSAFGGRKVENSNVKAGTGTRMGRPGDKPSRPERPSRPGKPEPQAEKKLVAIGEWSLEEMYDWEWSEEEMVSEGLAEWQEVETKSKPQRPSRPERPSRPGKPSRPGANGGDKPSRPAAKKPPQKKAPPKRKPAGPQVIMNEDSEYTYEELRDDHGWSDEEIVNSGYGTFDYTNPDN